MHAAPSVSYPVGRSAFAGRLLATLGVLAFAAAAMWTFEAAAFGWRQALAWAAAAGCGAFALHGWLRSPSGVLHWDGLAWHWQDARGSAAGSVEPVLDLQSIVLLQWRGEAGGARWLWTERTSDASHWDALRRAVYSRASASIPAFPESGKAPPTAGQPPAAEQ